MKVIESVSKTSYYNTNNQYCFINGWFFSDEGYDEIRINGYSAHIGLSRPDVHKNIPQCPVNCGYELEMKIPHFSGTVSLEAYLGGVKRYSLEKEIPIVEYGIDKKKNIILCGIDSNTESIYYAGQGVLHFKGILSCTGKKFHSLKKIDVQDFMAEKHILYIVADGEKDYWTAYLRNKGFHEFKDFVLASVFVELGKGKKMIIANGNCHISRVLAGIQNSELAKNYFIYHIPLIYLNKGKRIEEDVLSNTDVYIHQDIAENNKFGYKLSDAYTVAHLKSKCTEISIPNLFGIGRMFYPFSTMANAHDHDYEGLGLFPYADAVPEMIVKKNCKLEEAVEEASLLNGSITENFKKYMDTLIERERVCSVKISSYIMNHYKRKRIFWDPGHPTNEVIGEILRQIGAILRVDLGEVSIPNEMDTYQMPVYKAVKKALGILWDESVMRKETGHMLSCVEFNLKEYINQYIWWCYEIKKNEEDVL